jgi:murein DD-endopeptidase MepM/ murein hydrolase activator NlpD
LVSAPHLHYEVTYNGVKRDPVEYFFDDVDYVHLSRQQQPNEKGASLD